MLQWTAENSQTLQEVQGGGGGAMLISITQLKEPPNWQRASI